MSYDSFREKYKIFLNEQQEAAVRTVDGPVLLLAVPGSGKTTVLITRLAYLIFECNVPPEKILTVTYTVAAANDMKERFYRKFGKEFAERFGGGALAGGNAAAQDYFRAMGYGAAVMPSLEFRTINGIAARILHQYGRMSGKRPFELADERTANELIRDGMRAAGQAFPTENDIYAVRTLIAYTKNMLISPEDTVKKGAAGEVKNFPEIYKSYQKGLRGRELIDYDDQLTYALMLLEKVPQLRLFFQKKYSYLCVDEAQDTSLAQHRILRILAENPGIPPEKGDRRGADRPASPQVYGAELETENAVVQQNSSVGQSAEADREELSEGKPRTFQGNVFMVGDEDQSIYRFRAAYPEALTKFEAAYPGAKVLLMETNYRSRPEIVAAAQKFISENAHRHPKTMRPSRRPGGSVRVITVTDRAAQLKHLVDALAGDRSALQTAILYRNNESALPLVAAFEEKGIPYRLKGRSTFTYFTHPLVQDILAFINLTNNGFEGDAFLRIYYKTGAGIPKEAAYRAVDEASRMSRGQTDRAQAYAGNGYMVLDGRAGSNDWRQRTGSSNDRGHKSGNRDPRNLFDLVARQNVSAYTRKKCWELSKSLIAASMKNAADAIDIFRFDMNYDDYLKERQMDSSKADVLELLAGMKPDRRTFRANMQTLESIVRDGRDAAAGSQPVQLSTIHGAKGLEYDRVYLIDAVNGVLPSVARPNYLTAKEDEIDAYEEERRLFYVGMTRAKEKCTIFDFSYDWCPFPKEVKDYFREEKEKKKREKEKKEREKAAEEERKAREKAAEEEKKAREKAIASLSGIENGVVVVHSIFGRGAVVKRYRTIAGIAFEDGRVRNIDLVVALSKGLLRVE